MDRKFRSVVLFNWIHAQRIFKENMASHRAQQLLAMLPMALRFGATEIEPEVERLKVSFSISS